MVQDQTTETSMYCRKCGYQLVGLSANRCPECGRVFDPTDPRTFHRRAREPGLWRWMRRIALLMLTLVLLAGGGWGWLYWQWRAEQSVLAQLAQSGGWFRQEIIGSAWLVRGLGPRLSFVLERTCEVGLLPRDGKSVEIAAAQMSLLPRLSHLRILWLSHTKVTADGLEYLPSLPRLGELVLSPDQLTVAFFGALKRIAGLREIIVDTGNRQGYWRDWVRTELPNVDASEHLMTP
jgi:hypothetical protein